MEKEAEWFECIRLERIDELRSLIKKGITINEKDKLGRTGLHWAVLNQKEESLKWLCRQKGIDLNARLDETQKTPLMLAVRRPSVECIKILVDAGASMQISQQPPLWVGVMDKKEWDHLTWLWDHGMHWNHHEDVQKTWVDDALEWAKKQPIENQPESSMLKMIKACMKANYRPPGAKEKIMTWSQQFHDEGWFVCAQECQEWIKKEYGMQEKSKDDEKCSMQASLKPKTVKRKTSEHPQSSTSEHPQKKASKTPKM